MSEKNNLPASEELVITREFDAPRELVWKAFTEPERLKEWWGPKGFTMVTNKVDLKPGGLYHYCMKSPQGDEMWGKLVYVEIKPPEHLEYIVSFSDENGNIKRHPLSKTWPLEVTNILTLKEHNGKTTLTLRGFPVNASDEEIKTFKDGFASVKQGTKGMFDQLDEYLEKELKNK